MSILRLSAEVIRAGDTQADLISDRIKTSETVGGVLVPGRGQFLFFFSFSFVFSAFASMLLLYNLVIFQNVYSPGK